MPGQRVRWPEGSAWDRECTCRMHAGRVLPRPECPAHGVEAADEVILLRRRVADLEWAETALDSIRTHLDEYDAPLPGDPPEERVKQALAERKLLADRKAPTRHEVEQFLSHDSWCDKYGHHVECCPGKATFGCGCIVNDHINALIRHGWLRVRDDEGGRER